MSKIFNLFQKLDISPNNNMCEDTLFSYFEPKNQMVEMILPKHISRSEILEKLQSLKDDLEMSTLPTAIEIMKHKLHDPVLMESHEEVLFTTPSAFQLILNFFDLPEKVKEMKFVLNKGRAIALYEKLFKHFQKPTDKVELLPYTDHLDSPPYSTLIITQNADLNAAVDQLLDNWNDDYEPTVIRDVLVQESVRDKFFLLLDDRLGKLRNFKFSDAFIYSLSQKNLKTFQEQGFQILHDRIVLGIQRNYVEDLQICSAWVTLNTFRTSKEACSLYNKVNGGSASIWSESITETFELTKVINAKNIWINCHNIIHPSCVFTVGSKSYGGLKQTSFIEGNYFFTTIQENSGQLKSVVTRFGETFAN